MTLPVSALVIGLWSSAHCLAMCGGLALAAGQSGRHTGPPGRLSPDRVLELFSWQLGRVLSYAFMGAVAGAIGGFFLSWDAVGWAQTSAMVLANLLLILLGLHLARLSSLILWLEAWGQIVWRWVKPWAVASLTPTTTNILPGPPLWARVLKALRTGAIWGWLPCGLVYSMIVTASVTGTAGSGALWMLFFGLGTIPALLATSMASSRLLRAAGSPALRRAAGLLIVAFGLWGLIRAFDLVSIPWLDAFCITPRS